MLECGDVVIFIKNRAGHKIGDTTVVLAVYEHVIRVVGKTIFSVKLSDIVKMEEGMRVYFAGNMTIATDGKHKGIARCNPKDTFNKITGAALALARLQEEMK